MVNTIIAYKFTNLSRAEIDVMLGTKFEETRVYRETREEERVVIALNLLKQGALPIAAIAQATGLSIEQIQQLQSETAGN
jgi:predicted transposase YdaD